GELLPHEGHRGVGHAVVVEEIAGDEHQIDRVRQRPIDDALQDTTAALAMGGLLLGVTTDVTVEMHVSRVEHPERSARWHADSMPHPGSGSLSVQARRRAKGTSMAEPVSEERQKAFFE